MRGNRVYDVIQTLDQGNQCHLVLNQINGRTLEEICSQELNISKEQFYDWCDQIVRSVGNLHKCKPMNIYQFLTPYTIIVGADNQIYLLDSEHESNREVIQKLFDKRIQNAFFPKDCTGKRRPGIYHDFYSIGKIVQYILAKTDVSKQFGKMEEYQIDKMLKKIVETPDMKGIHNADNIRHMLQKCRKCTANRKKAKEKYNKISKKRKYLVLAASVIVMIASVQTLFLQAQTSKPPVIETTGMNFSSKSFEDDQMDELNWKMGILYYENLDDYESSIGYFRACSDAIAISKSYEILAKYWVGTYGVSKEEVYEAATKILDCDYEISEFERTKMYLDVSRIFGKIGEVKKQLEIIEERISKISNWENMDKEYKIQKELFFDATELLIESEEYEKGEHYAMTMIEKIEPSIEITLLGAKCISHNPNYDDNQILEKFAYIYSKNNQLKYQQEWGQLLNEHNMTMANEMVVTISETESDEVKE